MSNRGRATPEFAIAGITTYGRTVESLGRMLTGVLVLRGRDGGAPQADMLLMKEPGFQGKATANLGHRGAGEQR